jgi:hypothetical protein
MIRGVDATFLVEGSWLRMPTVASGAYTYVTGSGAGGSLNAYREVPEPTCEEYRAKGAKGPPLAIEFTPEEDAQLVREGVLPVQ